MNDSQTVFLAATTFAVAGASNDRKKYGNIVFRRLLSTGRNVLPINPGSSSIEGAPAYGSISDMPHVPESLSVVTPPAATEKVIREAIAAGVANIWMQPGAEHLKAGEEARATGLNVIDDGSCILVALSLSAGNRS